MLRLVLPLITAAALLTSACTAPVPTDHPPRQGASATPEVSTATPSAKPSPTTTPPRRPEIVNHPVKRVKNAADPANCTYLTATDASRRAKVKLTRDVPDSNDVNTIVVESLRVQSCSMRDPQRKWLVGYVIDLPADPAHYMRTAMKVLGKSKYIIDHPKFEYQSRGTRTNEGKHGYVLATRYEKYGILTYSRIPHKVKDAPTAEQLTRDIIAKIRGSQ